MATYDLSNADGTIIFETVDLDHVASLSTPSRTMAKHGNHSRQSAVGRPGVRGREPAESHPEVRHFLERDVVSFHVVDSMDGDSARGDWGGDFNGAVRPLLDWRTHYMGETK